MIHAPGLADRAAGGSDGVHRHGLATIAKARRRCSGAGSVWLTHSSAAATSGILPCSTRCGGCLATSSFRSICVDRAYDDGPLPIGGGQTISQPYIVAYMTQAIEPAKTDRVLEIGTGSGYQAAVLAELVKEVYTIEIVPTLAASSSALLKKLGYTNIHAREGDGYAGWPDAAPFDKIVVTAAPESIPQALVDQLKVGGIMAVPVGRGFQMMTIVRKTDTGTVTQRDDGRDVRADDQEGLVEYFELRPVGHVESLLTDLADAPRQPDEGAPEAALVFDTDVLEGLQGIRPGDDVLVLTWLDRALRDLLSVHPRGDTTRPVQGVFSTRAPHRPNPIGLHRVTVTEIDGARVLVRHLEALNGTPIIDLKPVLSEHIDER